MKDQNDRGDEHDSGAGEQREALKGTGEKRPRLGSGESFRWEGPVSGR